VKHAFLNIVGQGPKRNIAIVTSGGPIGVAITHVMHASAEKAIEVNWRVRNCSLTKFIFAPGRVSLDEFNSTPHLSDERLWTFR
jgi:broad specificity phosphatase PhoE